jgi:hypothetical protein
MSLTHLEIMPESRGSAPDATPKRAWKTRPFVERNRADMRARKFERGCDRCGHKGDAIYFIQPDGTRSCAQDLYVSRRKFVAKLAAARALCYNCHHEEIGRYKYYVSRNSCRVVHSTPALARLANADPAVAALVSEIRIPLYDPLSHPEPGSDETQSH